MKRSQRTSGWLVFALLGILHSGHAQLLENTYRIHVHLSNGGHVKGWLLSVTDSSVNVLITGRPDRDTAVVFRDIDRVSVRRKGSPGKGFVVGFSAGTVVGGLVGYASYSPPDCDGSFFCFDFGPGMSAMGGAVTGGFGAGLVGLVSGFTYKRFVISGDRIKFAVFRIELVARERRLQSGRRSRLAQRAAADAD